MALPERNLQDGWIDWCSGPAGSFGSRASSPKVCPQGSSRLCSWCTRTKPATRGPPSTGCGHGARPPRPPQLGGQPFFLVCTPCRQNAVLTRAHVALPSRWLSGDRGLSFGRGELGPVRAPGPSPAAGLTHVQPPPSYGGWPPANGVSTGSLHLVYEPNEK